MMSHFSAVPNDDDQSYSDSLLQGSWRGPTREADSVAGIPESQVIPCSLDEEFDPLSPSNMLPIGAATAVAPCLLCLPVACPLRSGQFKPTPGRTGGGTDAAGRADDLEMKKSRPTIGRADGHEGGRAGGEMYH